MPILQPRPERITKAVSYLSNHPIVSQLEEVRRDSEGMLAIVHRVDKGDLLVYLTDFYMLGIADVYEVRSKFGDLDAIVSVNKWGGYSQKVKHQSKQLNIAIFLLEEFLEAINYEERSFINYEYKA